MKKDIYVSYYDFPLRCPGKAVIEDIYFISLDDTLPMVRY